MQNDRSLSVGRRIGLKDHLLFTAAGLLTLMVMHSLLRLALLAYNREQIGGTSAEALAEAFFNGLRFDLRLAVFACIPLLLALPSLRAMNSARTFFRHWLTAFASITFFLGVVELDFYREFNQRLNGLVFQYLKEDPGTVLSMIWYGFPVLRYLLAWAAATGLLAWIFAVLDRRTRSVSVRGQPVHLPPRALRLLERLMRDPGQVVGRAELEALWRDEILPVFSALGSDARAQADAYLVDVRERFGNPFLNHRIADIAQNHAQKKERRLAPIVALAQRHALPLAQPRLQAALAST